MCFPAPLALRGCASANRIRRNTLILAVACATALPAPAASHRASWDSASQMPAGAPLSRVMMPSLPPGSEASLTPLRESGFAPRDPEVVAREQQQRAQEFAADLRMVGPIEALPAVGSAAFLKLRTDALAIVQRRYQESRRAIEDDAVDDFKSLVTWTPDFSAKPRGVSGADRDRAVAASYDVAYAITHLDRPRFVLAYAAAIFALDPDSALGAGNAASAIITSGERLHPTAAEAGKLRSYREDAAVVYRYALACSVDAGQWTLRSVGILINLGNLYVDMKDGARARSVLRAARAFAPESWDAALALAACYEMEGRSALARAVLEEKTVARPAIFAAAARAASHMLETHEAGEFTAETDPEEIEAVLEKFDRQEILTAADFAEGLDADTRNRVRAFVDNLPVQGSYRAPEIDSLTQFSTVAAINRPSGVEALSEFASRLGSYAMLMLGGLMNRQMDALARLGLNVQFDVDINDVMANPEKYQDHKINATVTGVEQLRARAEAMRRQLQQARGELEQGKTDTLLAIATETSPALGIYRLKPYDYANPMDVMIQQHNMSILARKMHAYNAYFFAVNDRTRESLAEISRLYAQKVMEIRAQESAEMRAFEKRRAAAAAAGQDTNTAAWRLMEHNIHRTYQPQYNAEAEFAWKHATQTAAVAYERKIKRRAERFYYDVFRHIALISDPHARDKKMQEFSQMLHSGVYHGLLQVLGAFGSYEYVEEWDCQCDVGSLQEQARREYDELEEIRFKLEQQGRLRFASGEIPPSSPLFKKLDEYGTDLDIPFIPLLGGRISAARSQLTLVAQLPTALSPKGYYTFAESAFTGATTHGGAIEVSASAKQGNVTVAATLGIRGAIALDGQGVVTNYSVTGAGNVKFGMGPTTFSAGGEIGYTPQGGVTGDVKGGIQSTFSDASGRSVTVSIESSARRGCTFSAKAEQNFNPHSAELNAFLKDVMEPFGEMVPIDTSIKKELWSGKFTL